MKEHEINHNDNFIMGFYTNENICDDIIISFNQRKNEHNTREDVPRGYEAQNLLEYENKIVQRYLYELNKCVQLYVKKYKYCRDTTVFDMYSAINVQHYRPENFYKDYHCETGMLDPLRHLVFMTYLNNVQEGGHTHFLYQNTKIKPEKGLTLIWPAPWTHTHAGQPTKEDKYIVTGWFEHLEKPSRRTLNFFRKRITY